MNHNQVFRKVCLLASALVTLFSYSYADTIVSVTDSLNTNARADYFLGGSSNSVVEVSWTQRAFLNVTIDAELVSRNTSLLSGTAFLMSAIGRGTTSASEIVAPVTFTAAIGPPSGPSLPPTVLFSGLTLAPGTYYLVITAPFQAGSGSPLGWQIPTNQVIAGTSASIGGRVATTPNLLFPPASTFSSGGLARLPMFDVTGTPVPTPEPSSLLILSTGVLGIAGAVRRKLRS